MAMVRGWKITGNMLRKVAIATLFFTFLLDEDLTYAKKELSWAEQSKTALSSPDESSLSKERLQAKKRKGWKTQSKTAVPRIETGLRKKDSWFDAIYGNITKRFQGHVDDAIVERVTIYPQKKEDSKKTIERHGIVVRYKHAKANILICHGFMCDKFDVGFLRYIFPQGDYNFMTFDFRAHGEKRGKQYCTFGHDEAQDVMAAARFLRSHPDLKKLPLIVYGFSMGAVASIEAQSKDNSLFDAMVLDCPFDSTENVLKKCIDRLKVSVFGYEFDLPGKSILQKYAFHPYVQSVVKALLKEIAHMDVKNIQTFMRSFSPAESIKQVKVPCFFIHCKQDEKVSVESIRRIYDGAGGEKMLWLTNGRRHFDSFFYNPERYAERVREFVNLVMDKNTEQIRDGHVMEDDDAEMSTSLIAHR